MIRSALAALALVVPFATGSAFAASTDSSVSYVLALGGINVALIDVGIKDDGTRYSLDLKANVSGLGSLVASGTAAVSARGSSAGNQLASSRFDLETRANGEVFTVGVDFDGGNVSAFKVNPPVVDSYDRVAIERRHLVGVGDFLSSFVLKGALDKGLCQHDFNIFTGVERFDIDLNFVKMDEATSPRTGYQGPVVLCSVKYKPVSGHYTSSDMTNYLADSSRILLWYAPLGNTGYSVPYRVLLGTSMGDLSMVLINMKP